MKRLNDFKFYELGSRLQPIEELGRDTTYKTRFHDLWFARLAVKEMLKSFPELHICHSAANSLIEAITEFVPDDWSEATGKDMDSTFGYRAYTIGRAKEAFEHVLSAELNNLDTYLLTQQGIYKTADLVDRAEMSFSEETRKIISDEAKKDFRQGGRCLAFELPTAAGYHTLRATEAVLRQYYRLVKDLPVGTKSPEMAQCINELKSAGEDAKLMNILDGIRDLHRNPQMHPEAFLSMEEATELFDITKSAINAMARRISELLATGAGKLLEAAIAELTTAPPPGTEP
jgi:hypothetical protein